MNEHAKRIRKPRCLLLYALAPSSLRSAEANRILNAFIGDPGLPMAIFHDYFMVNRAGRHLSCGDGWRELGNPPVGVASCLWKPKS